MEVIKTFEKVNKTKIPYSIGENRTGDLEKVYAKIDLAYEELGWKPMKDLESMCKSAWNWTAKD